MNVLIIASYAESLIRFRGPLLSAFQEQGCDVHVASPDLPENSIVRKKLESLGYIVHDLKMQRTGMNAFSDLITLLELVVLMKRSKISLVLGYTIKPVIYGTLAGWIARVPARFALITGLGYSFQENERRSFKSKIVGYIARRLYSGSLRFAHKVFFQNPDDEALFRHEGIISSSVESRVVNGSGVNLTEYSFKPVKNRYEFLLIARLLGDKGIREYVEAARIVKASYPSAVFKLVGWIDNNPNAIDQHELDTWQQEGVISYVGKLEDVRPELESCSVYVLPSYREGTPRTVLEAMAIGRPIISTDAPGCRETVEEGINGFLVPVRNIELLAKAMMKFLNSPSLVESMGLASREIAEEKYNVDLINHNMLTEMGVLK